MKILDFTFFSPNMKKLITKINTILQENLIISPSQNLLCTVSSGQDSILLFLILLHFKNQWNLNLGLVYCHHFWQTTNFFSFWQIWKIAFLFDLPYFFVLTEQKLSTENQARNWRQKSLERVAVLQNFDEIAFGHTGSDKLETSLWNMIRGSSPKGLNSIQQNTLAKISFVQFFFSVNSSTSFKTNKKYFQPQNQFFSRLNSRKKYLELWSLPRNFFHFSKKRRLIKSALSPFSQTPFGARFGFLVTTFNIQVENCENSLQFFIFQKEQKDLNLFILQNFLFCSFCCKKKSFGPFLRKIRPLIALHREDILKITEYFFMPVIPDPTNSFSNFSRSKIRNQLLPVIRYLFSTHFDFSFIQFLKILENESFDSEKSLNFLYKKFTKNVFLSHFGHQTEFGEKNKVVVFPQFSLIQKTSEKKNEFLQFSSLEKKKFLSRLIRSQFQKLPISIQSKILKKIFFYYSSSQLNYAQIETLQFLILKKTLLTKTFTRLNGGDSTNKKLKLFLKNGESGKNT